MMKEFRAETTKEKETQADKLVKLASDLELFHNPDHSAFVVIEVDGHREVYKLRSKSFRAWLQRTYYQAYGHAASAQALQDALGTLEGKATFEGKTSPVYVRLAKHDDKIYLDLANDAWQVVEVSPTGWKVLAQSPVYFWRPKGLESLPIPVYGGSIQDLKKFVKLTDEHFTLLLAYLVACLCPGIPYPVLLLVAEQGSGKSTLTKILKALVDPNTAPLRSQPRDVRDLMISATNSWLVAFDNLSNVLEWLSDALCRMSTGGGFSTRTLYADDEETIFDVTRPVILNGITDLATRGDLLDRAVVIQPQRITNGSRKTEGELWAEFETLRPALLGSLLTVVSQGLAKKDSVRLEQLPRMADFAVWATACETALGFQHGSFMEAYTGNRASAHETVLEGSPLALLIRSWLKADGAKFEGTYGQLFDRVNELATEEMKRLREFPKTTKALSNSLRRLAPNLRGVGIEVDFLGHSDKGNKVRLEKVCKERSAHSDVQDEENNVQDEGTHAERLEGAERLNHVYSDEEAIEYDPS
jgi:energy-coupling factor transporter ATP-binding protein EcfA2